MDQDGGPQYPKKTDWENYGLTKVEGEGCHNHSFLCKSIILDKYNDLYDYDWNTNDRVVKSHVNKRIKPVVVLDSVSRLPSLVFVEEKKEFTFPNFKEIQILSLKNIKIRIFLIIVHLKNSRSKKNINLYLHLLFRGKIPNANEEILNV